MNSPAKIALYITCFLWAISFVATKTAVESVPPLTIVTLRLIVSTFCFFLWFLIRGHRFHFEGFSWLWKMFLLSLFGTGLHFGLQTIGLKYTTASNASIYSVTAPISIMLLSALFLGERITLRKGLGLMCALIGVLTVLGLKTLLAFEITANLFGDMLVFASIFMWGAYTVLGKDVMKKTGPLYLAFVATLIGTLYMIPVGILELRSTGFNLLDITMMPLISILFLGITCSFLATLLYFFALEKMDSQKVGIYLYTVPPMTYIFSAVFLGESIGMNLIFGSMLVITGVYITQKG